MKTQPLQVVAAVIENKGEILCVQRGPNKWNYIANKWEFPGGKIRRGESEPDALFREIKEELMVEVEVGDKLITVDHEYPDFRLLLHAYGCTVPHRGLTLIEHIALEWRDASNLLHLDWAAADIPIAQQVQQRSTVMF